MNSRLLAYLLVGVLGFIVGAGLFILGRYLGDIVKEVIPSILGAMSKPSLVGMLVSGFIGMIIAIVLSYIWASREQMY